MLFVYGALMPLRILEEIRFWKTQEKEHTVVIRALVPNLEPDYVRVLHEWEDVFAKTEYAAQQWIETVIRADAVITPYMQQQVELLMNTSISQSQKFVQQLMIMQNQSAAIQSNPTAQVVIQHIIRESEYFLGVLHEFSLNEPPPGLTAGLLHRNGDLTAAGEGSWLSAATSSTRPNQNPVPIGGHVLPPLPYSYNALEPAIDAETMRLHHDIHHKSYVDGLNKAERMLAKARESSDFDLVKHWEREAAFNGAGHYLHTIFWNIMTPKTDGKPTGAIAAEITKDFGSCDAFRKHFSAAAEKVEGGGWALLVWSPRSHRLEILQAEKHQNLSQWDVIPLLVLDVWEHAYYLKYHTERAKYIEAWWNLVHWQHVNERFSMARMVKWQPY
jgi:Fe-Mn family superoxide dismutase